MDTKTDLDTILANMGDTITVNGASDTITLSGYDHLNSTLTSGTLGSTYTYPNTVSITGSNTAPYTISTGTGITNPWATHATPKIKLDGEGADIEVNGWSLIDAIQKIEERLNVLTVNEKLEAEWEELRALGNRYRELEQQIKDKQATWDRLKAMPPVID
jgi:hypothetical protein